MLSLSFLTKSVYGCGIDTSITVAPIKAVISAKKIKNRKFASLFEPFDDNVTKNLKL